MYWDEDDRVGDIASRYPAVAHDIQMIEFVKYSDDRVRDVLK